MDGSLMTCMDGFNISALENVGWMDDVDASFTIYSLFPVSMSLLTRNIEIVACPAKLLKEWLLSWR